MRDPEESAGVATEELERLRRRVAELEARAADDGSGEEWETWGQAIQSSINGIALSDRHGTLTFVNRSFLRMWGYDEAREVLGRPAASFWESEEGAERVIQALGEQGAWVGELTARRKGGQLFPVQLSAAVVKGRTGRPIGMMGSFVDISERRRAEAALRRSEARYRALFETMAQGVVYQAPDGRIISANPAAERILGLSRAQMQGRSSLDPRWRAIREDGSEFPGDRHPAMESLRTGKPVSGVTMGVLHPAHNQYRWILIDAVPEFLPGEAKPHRVYTTFTDITERRKAEAAQQAAKEYAEGLIETANSIVVGLDARGNVTVFNRAAEAITGYSRSELLGRSWFEKVVPRDRYPAVWAEFERLKTGGLPRNFENPILTKAGEERYVVWQNNELYEHGEVAGTISFGIDITARRKAEQERLELERRLLHAQKLESLGILAGGIAHDFNNLLMAILANLEMALRKLPPASPAHANIERSAQAAHRATDLTRQMLAYSGKGRFVVETVDLSALVEENTHLFRASVARTATLEVRLDRSLPPVEADAGQVQQVIMNLITNASESIGEGPGRIVVTTGVEDCDATRLRRSRIDDVPPAGRFVCLEVSDTGCGMDEETQQRLFDPFFTTKAPGRGLGMSAILGIVRGHRGAIFVESTVGRGTSMRILLPAVERTLPPKDPAARATAETGALAPGGAVLVVDDEAPVRTVCRDMVESLGLTALTAVDGRDAVEQFTRNADAISHVILDLSMPNMDGLAAFAELVRLRPGVKVILCSGYSEQESVQRMAGCGLAGFIQKPYSLQSLRDALEKAGASDR